eukprot:14046639-Alexandrium_andersonii.AAC.1
MSARTPTAVEQSDDLPGATLAPNFLKYTCAKPPEHKRALQWPLPLCTIVRSSANDLGKALNDRRAVINGFKVRESRAMDNGQPCGIDMTRS